MAEAEVNGGQVAAEELWLQLENGESSPVKSHMALNLLKSEHDNPKINAIVVVEGSPADAVTLFPLTDSSSVKPNKRKTKGKDLGGGGDEVHTPCRRSGLRY